MVNKIPILNKSLYAFKFTEGMEIEYSASIIADKMWAQWDNGVIIFFIRTYTQLENMLWEVNAIFSCMENDFLLINVHFYN